MNMCQHSIALPINEHHLPIWKRFTNPIWLFIIVTVLTFTLTLKKLNATSKALSSNRIEEIPNICRYNSVRPHYAADPYRINERSQLFNSKQIILQNATLIDGDGSITENIDIALSNSTIVDVGKDLKTVHDHWNIIPLNGAYVTPGLVDMHTHFGTRPQPQLFATEDTNEFTNPVTPYMRSIDGIDPNDPDMDSLLASGVTTHLVLTGSRNVISGESYAIKLHKPPHNEAREMLVQYGLPSDNYDNKPVRWFKMSYGENEKNWKLQRVGDYPVSRMGENAIIRESFDSATKLMKKQDEWCSNPKYRAETTEYPTDIKLDTLVSILRGDVNLNIHVYEGYDMEALLRTADEFGFRINAFHHAMSAWTIPKLLKEHNITLALFAEDWGGKKEQYMNSVFQPKLLTEAGLNVALKTDHPALPGQELLFQAQIAHNYGLSSEKAIAAITSIPAKSINLSHRIGYARKGYDADLVIWKDHPLMLGAHPVEVIIDGMPRFNFTKIDQTTNVGQAKQRQVIPQQKSCNSLPEEYLVTGLHYLYYNGSEAYNENTTAFVSNGLVSILKNPNDLSQYSDLPVITLKDGYLLPGAIAVAPSIGLREITLEDDTSDGQNSNSELISAADGIRTDGLMPDRLIRSGVDAAVTAPLGESLIKGISTYFRLGDRNSLDDTIIKSDVALHFNIGNGSKNPETPTISSQISKLRKVLANISDTYKKLPVVIHTHNAQIMKHIIQLKKREFPDMKFVIVGGQEAYLIADELADAEISVVLAPWRCTAKFWNNRFCSPNLPLEEKSSVQILKEANVTFALGQEADEGSRRSFWDAGWAKALINGFTLKDASDLISKNVETIFGLPASCDFVIFEHNPFEFGATLALTSQNGHTTRCFPDIEEPIIGDELARIPN